MIDALKSKLQELEDIHKSAGQMVDAQLSNLTSRLVNLFLLNNLELIPCAAWIEYTGFKKTYRLDDPKYDAYIEFTLQWVNSEQHFDLEFQVRDYKEIFNMKNHYNKKYLDYQVKTDTELLQALDQFILDLTKDDQ